MQGESQRKRVWATALSLSLGYREIKFDAERHWTCALGSAVRSLSPAPSTGPCAPLSSLLSPPFLSPSSYFHLLYCPSVALSPSPPLSPLPRSISPSPILHLSFLLPLALSFHTHSPLSPLSLSSPSPPSLSPSLPIPLFFFPSFPLSFLPLFLHSLAPTLPHNSSTSLFFLSLLASPTPDASRAQTALQAVALHGPYKDPSRPDPTRRRDRAGAATRPAERAAANRRWPAPQRELFNQCAVANRARGMTRTRVRVAPVAPGPIRPTRTLKCGRKDERAPRRRPCIVGRLPPVPSPRPAPSESRP